MKILLADDHTIVREGLRLILSRQSGLDIIAEVSDGAQALEKTKELEPDVVVMDVVMHGMDGITATRRIKSICPETQVVALSMYADKNFINEMLKAGASAFLLKDCASTELIEAINAVKEGTLYLGPSVSGIVARMYVDSIGGVEEAGEKDTLSDREMEILKLLAEGKTNGEIALELHVSIKTIGSHRRNILHKLGLRNIVELTKYALAKGIIPTISS